MLVSIITSSFNSSKTISDTIESVLNQDYNNIEYIIVDGLSKDNTVEIIKSYEEKFQNSSKTLKWISESDTGIYNAWNKALKMVTGDWIVFIGSDDYYKTSTIVSEIVPYLKEAESKNINYVYGKTEHVDENKKFIEVIGKPWEEQKARFTYAMNIQHSGAYHNKVLFEKHGDFDESFKITGDYNFLLREFKNPNNNALFADIITVVMREGGISASLHNRLKVVHETKRSRKLNGINAFSKELVLWEVRVRTIELISSIFGSNFGAKLADFYRMILGKQKRWSN